MRRLAEVDWASGASHFVSLTYHEDWGEWREWKGDLKAYLQRLFRRYGDRVQSVLWKLEPQKRGAPHFHLVVFWRPGREPLEASWRRWAMGAWNQIVAVGDRAHLRHGCKVQRVRNTTGPEVGRLMRYLVKYLGKTGEWVDPETGEVRETGRCWGEWGDLPTAVLGRVLFGAIAWDNFLSRIREWGSASPYLRSLDLATAGALIFGDGGELLEIALLAGGGLSRPSEASERSEEALTGGRG